jgi:fibronectin-binding autotransporter adhesin
MMNAVCNPAHASTRRKLALLGTALGTTLVVAPAHAQNITYNGAGPYSLTRTDPVSGGPRAVDITSTNGDITLDLASVTSNNTGTARGVGIAAIETGAGNVSVKSGTTTATGSGPSSAIDARSTTGSIVVNSGTATATSANSTAIQAANSAGGTVTVTSGTATGGLRGIFTSFTGGTTTINSTLATASGAGGTAAPNAIVGQGRTVIVNSGTATLTGAAPNSGSQGTAIFVQSGAGGATITSGTASTQGQGQNGIQFYSDTTGSVDSGAVTTAGAYARGIYANATTANVVKSATVTTAGDFATGIYVSPSPTSGNANTPAAGTVNVTSGTITTTGANAGGILVSPITPTGNGNASVLTGAIAITSDTIKTSGAGSIGIQVTGATGAVGVNSTTINASGGGIFTDTTGIGATTITSGTMTTTGAGARGIQAYATNGNMVINAGTTTTTGGYDPNVGDVADAITAFTTNAGTASATITSVDASAKGDYASAIFASVGGNVAITSGTASSAGIQAATIGGSSRTGDVTINATTTTQIGTGGTAVSGQATTGNVTVTSGTATSDGGNAVSATAGKIATVNATTASTTANGGQAVRAVGGTGVVLTVGSASSTGTATSTTNPRTGVVTVTRADAVSAVATTGTINATIGSATATGAGADAVRLIANGTGGAVTTTITGAVSSRSGNGLFIDPPGAVIVNVGTGGSIAGGLAGINTTGASNTITNAGIITATAGAAITASGTTALTNSGTLSGSNGTAVQLGATDDTVTLRTGSVVTGAINGGGGTDAAILNGTAATATATQAMASFTGFNSLAVQAGYWTAPTTGSSSFATATINAGGTLELANGTVGLTGVTAPTFTDNGALVVRSAATSAGSTFGGSTVTGAGTVLFTGSGIARLDGTNSLANTGGIAIDGGSTLLLTGTQGGNVTTATGGTFQIGNGGTTGLFTGNLVDNGTLVVNRSDAYAFNGALTGDGTIVKQGAGQLVFGSGYAFTGTTTIQAGSVKLTAPVATTTELAIEGAGQLDLSGSNQRVAELGGNSTSASINIAGGSLTVNQATNTSFGGNLTGNGSFTKTGTGKLIFAGANTYTGPTTVSGGTLAVNGSIASPVTVTAGGTLAGTGSVGTTTIQSGGTYAPGNSIGTQTVNGNVTFATGSIFAIEANAAGQADRVNATGTATLQGGTVAVNAAAGTYGNLTNYTILTAGGGVTGTFAGATSNFAFLTPLLSYSANAVTLSLARNDVTFGSIGTNANQRSVGNAITSLGVGSGLYRALLPMTAATAQGTLGTLSGEIYASETAVLADSGRRVREAVLNRGSITGDGIALWVDGIRNLAESRNQTATIAPVSTHRLGTVGGVEFGLGGFRVGIDGGYVRDHMQVRTLASRASIDTTTVGAHAGYVLGPIVALIGGSYSWHDIDTTRSTGIAAVAGSSKGHSYQGFGELAYSAITGPLAVTPFARFSYTKVELDGLTETGGTGALSVRDDDHHYQFATAGLRFTGEASITTGVTLLPRMAISYTQGFDLRNRRNASFAGTSTQFGIEGTQLGRHTLDVNGGADLAFGQRLTIGASGFGSTSGQWSDYGGKVALGIRF